MQRVGLYVRVSTQEQADKGWSIDAQYAELRKSCDSHKDWKVVRAFNDPGYTAANLDRPGIRNLLECAQRGKLDLLVVWRYDRLSRDNLDFPLLLLQIVKSDPGMTMKLIAEELGVSSQLALYHIRKRSQKGLLVLERRSFRLSVQLPPGKNA